MIVDGEHTFRGPRERVWGLLQDPEVLVKAMPGARRLVATGDGAYEGVIRIGVGPVTAAEWKLSVNLADRVPPESYTMLVEGKGALGFTRGNAKVELLEEDGGTTMRYHADLLVGGKVASVGQRLLDQVAKLLTKQGLEALSREMDSRLAAAPAMDAEPLGVDTASLTEDAAGAGDDVAESADASAASGDAVRAPTRDAAPKPTETDPPPPTGAI